MAGRSPAARMWLRTCLVLACVLGLDQLSKALVRGGIDVGAKDSVLPGLTLVHTKNRGVAFSALEGRTGIITVVIALAVVGLLVYVARHAATPGIWVPAGLLTGGALGNIVDRAAFGEVTDFVKLPAWPAFNVADMAITFGVLALLYVTERSQSSPEGSDPVTDASAAPRAPRPVDHTSRGVSDAVDSRS